MSQLETVLLRGFSCDGKGVNPDRTACPHRIEGQDLPYFDGLKHYQELAAGQGWQCWVGRTRRFYCPECNPTPGHKMRLLWGEPRATSLEI